MYLSKLNNRQKFTSHSLLGKALLLGFVNVEQLREYSATLDKDEQNQPIYPEDQQVEVIQLSLTAEKKYIQIVQQFPREAEDFLNENLSYDVETGLLSDLTGEQIKSWEDGLKVDSIRSQSLQLLKNSDAKILPDNAPEDIERWTLWRDTLRDIVRDPLSFLGKEWPATPFNVSWKLKGKIK